MSHKIYPIGIQNFEKIRNDGYFYLDKTALNIPTMPFYQDMKRMKQQTNVPFSWKMNLMKNKCIPQRSDF